VDLIGDKCYSSPEKTSQKLAGLSGTPPGADTYCQNKLSGATLMTREEAEAYLASPSCDGACASTGGACDNDGKSCGAPIPYYGFGYTSTTEGDNNWLTNYGFTAPNPDHENRWFSCVTTAGYQLVEGSRAYGVYPYVPTAINSNNACNDFVMVPELRTAGGYEGYTTSLDDYATPRCNVDLYKVNNVATKEACRQICDTNPVCNYILFVNIAGCGTLQQSCLLYESINEATVAETGCSGYSESTYILERKPSNGAVG